MPPEPLPPEPQPDPLPQPLQLPQPPAAPQSSAAPETVHHPDLAASAHRGNGIVAHLPKTVRDQINLMLLDGVTYLDIIQRLGDAGKDLKPAHIGEWKKRGYQDWLQQREWLDHVTAKSEFSSDLLARPNITGLHEAGLRLAASYMLDQLTRFAALASDPHPEIFARLVNALSRLTREAVSLQKYHDACAREALLQLKEADPNRDLTTSDHDIFRKKLEEFFHAKIPTTPPPAQPDDFLESP